MRVFMLHLRNSPIRWVLPALIGLSLAVLFLRSRYWIGVWPETGAAGQVGTYFVGALGAGAAAWAAGAPTRHRLQEQMAAARVHPLTAEAYRLAATVVILLVPYLVGQAVAVAVTAPSSAPGFHLWTGYFVMGLVAMLLATCWGWVLGKILGSVFASLAAAVGWLVMVIAIQDYLEITITALRGPPERMVQPAAAGLQLFVTVLLLVALPWIAVKGRGWHRALSAAIPTTAGVALVAILATTTVVVERDPIGDQAHCVTGAKTQLCIWPEHVKYVPQLEMVNKRIDALPDVLKTPSRMNEFGVERTSYVDSDGVINMVEGFPPEFAVIEGSPWSYAGAIQSAIMRETWGDCMRQVEITDEDRLRSFALDGWLRAYLVGGGSPDFSTSAPPQVEEAWARGRAMASKPLATQFDWVEQEIANLKQTYCP